MDNKKKILVVDDSALMRRMVCDIINLDEQFCVQDMAANGLEAISLMQKNTYDAVILDIIMPKLDGIGVLKEINRLGLQEHVVMFSSEARKDAEITLQALELGAMDFIHKPDSILEAKENTFVRRFLAILSSAVQSRPQPKTMTVRESSRRQIKKQPVIPDGNAVVAIACSTGGPKALAEVIPRLPENLDAPVLIVQHMPEGFTRSFSNSLDQISRLSVKEAENGDKLYRGRVLIAPGNKHMLLKRVGKEYFVEIKEGPLVNRHRPSVDVLFRSAARYAGNNAIGVILTGMGNDGARGMKEMHDAGAHTIAQDEQSCVVYGMPKEAYKMGGVDDVVALDKINNHLVRLLTGQTLKF